MPFSDYKVALVTGASAGMGEAIVERLCQEGIEVHAVGCDTPKNIQSAIHAGNLTARKI